MSNDHPDFNDSRYFNFHDRSNDITGFMRVGMKPNRAQKSLFFFLMQGNQVMGIKTDEEMTNERYFCKSMKFIPLDDDCWNLSYDGSLQDSQGGLHTVKMDLKWKPLNEEFDYRDCVTGKNVELSAKVASEHYEQFGSITGTIIIDNNELHISGLGERDQSIGVRDWGAPQSWLWINSQFSEKEAFNITKLVMDRGTIDSGFFHHGGKNRPITSIEANIEESTSKRPVAFELKIRDSEGQDYSIKGRIVKEAMMPFQGADGTKSIIVETLAEYNWNGQIGHGIAEFMYRL